MAQHGPDNALIQCNGFDSSKTEISPTTRRRFPFVTMASIFSKTNSAAISGDVRGASLRPAILNRDGATLDPTKFHALAPQG
jgi:hypothetical protein